MVDHNLGYEGATSLSEALKVNSALKRLNLCGSDGYGGL